MPILTGRQSERPLDAKRSRAELGKKVALRLCLRRWRRSYQCRFGFRRLAVRYWTASATRQDGWCTTALDERCACLIPGPRRRLLFTESHAMQCCYYALLSYLAT